MKTFVIGDIHGTWRALKQCLQRSDFNYEKDVLVQLGDVVDGYPEVFECVEELLSIHHLIAIRGNHDNWFTEYLQTGIHADQWKQGGKATALSYLKKVGKEDLIVKTGVGYLATLNPDDVPEAHQQFFKEQRLYYIDKAKNCFVHAGFDRHQPFKGQQPDMYYWDRELWLSALSFKKDSRRLGQTAHFNVVDMFHEIFIGHTSTTNWKTDKPMNAANIWNLDTGAGYDGRLTIMEVESKTFWQSDPVAVLYPEIIW